MISTFKTHKLVEKRLKFLPAKIKRDPEDADNFSITILDQKSVKVRTYREMEEEPRSFITEARIEYNGEVSQKYTTSCYFHQVPTAIWYTESLIVDLEEKSQKINEKAYYVNQLRPDYWSETFETDVTSKEKMFVSETMIPISHESDYIHYISLENQQDKPENEMV
ncbi:hypothetical protein WA026_017733 [Henosepilachna vigintioctopunctata]|uniref:Uncharacterized protein n=1 Tax=Henosepilachna vigintioctopunctata TaxID=420089 RepID=A0AAW1U341_9CUCU